MHSQERRGTTRIPVLNITGYESSGEATSTLPARQVQLALKLISESKGEIA
jgi:hypothetical protein